MPEEAQNAQQVGSLSGAWAGGQDGMRVTNIFLDQVEVRQFCCQIRRRLLNISFLEPLIGRRAILSCCTQTK